MAKKILSPAKSFKNWRFSKWFLGNWSTIKEGLKVGIPAVISYIATKNLALSGFLTIIGKFILDTGEYWFKEIKKK